MRKLLIIVLIVSGVCMAQEPMSSEEQRKLAGRELAAITILREYIAAQKQYNAMNYERGYCLSVGPLIKLKLLSPEYETSFMHTNGGRKYAGYVFVDDLSVTDPTKELGLWAVPDMYGVDGVHIFWIGENEIVYEIDPKGQYGQMPTKPEGVESPRLSVEGWRKTTDPISTSVLAKSIENINVDHDSEEPSSQVESSQGEDNPATTLQDEGIIIRLGDLKSDYETNEVAADKKYNAYIGKPIRVYGTVNRITVDRNTQRPLIFLKESVMLTPVTCLLSDETSIEEAASLQPNLQITVEGIWQGKPRIMEPTITDARIVR